MDVAIFFYRMGVSTLQTIATAATGVVCAHLGLVSLVKLALKELVDK